MPWTDAVDAATQGRVKIELYAEETLVKEADQYDAVVSGLADLARAPPTLPRGASRWREWLCPAVAVPQR